MSPKSKAKELIEKYADALPSVFYNSDEAKNYPTAKKCVLIAVDEIISEYGTYYKVNIDDKYVSYWQEVKQEIEKL
jgi:hypothetical protein